jgi:phosphoglycolate phosphatase-like HAD superfamily hydrolase
MPVIRENPVRLRNPTPYEALVSEAALASGLNASHAARLEASWDQLQPWADASALLRDLAPAYRLGIVTNCSERLGRRAATRLQAPFECIATAERTGNYKSDPAAGGAIGERRTRRRKGLILLEPMREREAGTLGLGRGRRFRQGLPLRL